MPNGISRIGQQFGSITEYLLDYNIALLFKFFNILGNSLTILKTHLTNITYEAPGFENDSEIEINNEIILM